VIAIARARAAIVVASARSFARARVVVARRPSRCRRRARPSLSFARRVVARRAVGVARTASARIVVVGVGVGARRRVSPASAASRRRGDASDKTIVVCVVVV
jgi:hypothetical protein